MNSIIRGFKTIHQVGLLPVLQVGLYRFGLLTGHYRRVLEAQHRVPVEIKSAWLQPDQSFRDSVVAGYLRHQPDLKEFCLTEAEMILGGKCRIFGHQIVDIFQEGLDTTRQWTEYESGRVKVPVEDIKFIWEPARLGWVYSLARAYVFDQIPLLGNRGWGLIERSLKLNPVNYGPNWMNGQEVALRILALVFFYEVFRNEPDMPVGWDQTLFQAVADHAQRIPPTLVYAQSQQNNHLLVETAGLYTAGVFLPAHPEAENWRKIGWQVFHKALDEQIEPDGTYAQFSTNYHRLMLQVALWLKAVSLRVRDEFPETSSQKLAAATNWLKNLTDPETGRVPNYGHNDGACILPLTESSHHDFRPVVLAAERLFGQGLSTPLPDEMTLWFEWLAAQPAQIKKFTDSIPPIQSYRKLVCGNTSAVLFAPNYSSRPGQADVLHTEIWRDGNPITLDAGTYRYNADPPWDNTLAQTKYHNTLTVFEQNQMQKAGRFLWLDWPKTQWLHQENPINSIAAMHDAYRRYGIIHKRQVEYVDEHIWRVFDEITPVGKRADTTVDIWLHWLLVPLEWSITNTGILSGSGKNRIKIDVISSSNGTMKPIETWLIKAGELIDAQPAREIPLEELTNFGWVSTSYAIKEPAYSYRVLFRGKPPFNFHTQFQFG